MHWDDFRFVLAVVRARSIKAAAQALATTESTVSRHIAQAEKRHEIVLFERTPAGMVPTPPCERLVKALERAEAEFELGLDAALDLDARTAGVVRITAVPTLVNHVLVPQVPNLIDRHSELWLECIATPSDLSMMQREADLALRLGALSGEMEALTRRVGLLHYAVFAAKGMGDPAARTVPWVTYDSSMSKLPQAQWVRHRMDETGELACALQANDGDGILAAALTGMGRAVLPRKVAERFPDLVEVEGYIDLPSRDLWLLTHPNLAKSPRIRAVVNWLVSLLDDKK